ncbi:MAG: hypothetical protein K2M84_01750 [Anaeroplasmataceae bacterium]|nr:hypothetical protein [Anaeroplasmataceae bacterium]MDE7384461.1 hypothetical protein [Anaeroplasmataceae bacterium]
MLEHIKNNYVNICIAIVYTILASLVYGIWSYSAWHLWYVTLIIVIAIVGIGSVIGYFWIRSEIKKNQPKEEPKEETIVQ